MPTVGPLSVSPFCFGGNVLGWTADTATSNEILDAYLARGGNFIDTADAYSAWAPGHRGGESETLIGNWMQDRGNRSDLVIATKVGKHPDLPGLSAATVARACDDSLRRLQTDYIDLYYCHADDPDVPLSETVAALGELVRAGKVRALGLSNYSPERIDEAMAVCAELGVPGFVALQPHYNLMQRDVEHGAVQACERHKIACLPYFGLAAGFLTGKYRTPADAAGAARGPRVDGYFTERGHRVLSALDSVADRHEVPPAAVALAWLLTRPTVASVLASATSVQQLEDWMRPVILSEDDIEQLTAASSPGER